MENSFGEERPGNPEAHSEGNRKGRVSPPRRSGQSADYYPPLDQAVKRLGQSTAETRRAIYDRARTVMVAQLRCMRPPLSESAINCEQLALEGAIRKVETESLRRSRTLTGQPGPLSWAIQEIAADPAKMSNVGELSPYAPRQRSPRIILTIDDDQADDDFAFVKKLITAKPDLSADLEALHNEIRRCDRRRSLMSAPTRKLVHLTIMGLLVLTASGAY
jgi:hypothetical protein